MKFYGEHIEDANRTIARCTARLLDDETKWICFVQETKLTLGRFAIRGIREDAAAQKIAMEVGDERADITDAQRLRAALESAIAPHERFHILVPQLLVRVVHRQIAAVVGNTNVGMREQELA